MLDKIKKQDYDEQKFKPIKPCFKRVPRFNRRYFAQTTGRRLMGNIRRVGLLKRIENAPIGKGIWLCSSQRAAVCWKAVGNAGFNHPGAAAPNSSLVSAAGFPRYRKVHCWMYAKRPGFPANRVVPRSIAFVSMFMETKAFLFAAAFR